MNYLEELKKVRAAMSRNFDELHRNALNIAADYVCDEWAVVDKAIKKIEKIQRRADKLLGELFSSKAVKNEFVKKGEERP